MRHHQSHFQGLVAVCGGCWNGKQGPTWILHLIERESGYPISARPLTVTCPMVTFVCCHHIGGLPQRGRLLATVYLL